MMIILTVIVVGLLLIGVEALSMLSEVRKEVRKMHDLLRKIGDR